MASSRAAFSKWTSRARRRHHRRASHRNRSQRRRPPRLRRARPSSPRKASSRRREGRPFRGPDQTPRVRSSQGLASLVVGAGLLAVRSHSAWCGATGRGCANVWIGSARFSRRSRLGDRGSSARPATPRVDYRGDPRDRSRDPRVEAHRDDGPAEATTPSSTIVYVRDGVRPRSMPGWRAAGPRQAKPGREFVAGEPDEARERQCSEVVELAGIDQAIDRLVRRRRTRR